MTVLLPATPVSDAPARGSDYARLSRLVKSAGLLDRRRGHYAGKTGALVGVAVAGAVAFVVLGDSWWQLGIAALFAVISAQVGFLGHDAGHRQVFASRRANDLFGLACANLGIGLSFSWWMDKHVRHHAHPNDEERDPDIGAGALVFTTGQARRAGQVGRFLYRYQAWTFFPLLLLEALNLHVSSVRHLAGSGSPRRRREVALLALHTAAYFSAVFLVLSPLQAVAFIAVHQGLLGVYLGCSFAPNHKGMPTLSEAEERDFLRRQVLTSRNVRRHWLTDVLLGGLNYQIEHHLFPSMPRPNLRHAQPIVERFCAEARVPYAQTGPFRSYSQVLRHLDTVGRAARLSPA
ncbi:MAG TPA: acyl-CoA desaturase [Rugosimonospora sp.]|nr:acyl-CoA desaturase [Rugosimonospora sp.]